MNHSNSKSILSRRGFLQTTAAASVLSSANMLHSSETRPPNIVLILADDLGYECLGCNGGESYATPHLDALAEDGMRFTHCYSNPVCSPSRTCIMTGRYTFRNGTNTSEAWGMIPDDEITFGHTLQEAGYATALAGKWQMQLLKDNPLHVKQMGFEESCCWAWHEGPRYDDPWIWQNGELFNNMPNQFGPDIYCQFLMDFMEKNNERPFLAYYPMTLTHFPKTSGPYYEPPPKGGRHKTFAEMVETMDELVGRIVQELDDLNLRDNTLILFTGDNGTPTQVTSRWNGKSIRGGKRELTDAGTHVPLIANWKGTTPSGTVNDSLIDFSDFHVSMAELAHAKLPDDRVIDGKSFVPQLRGSKSMGKDWVYTEWNGKKWIRNRRWKLYQSGEMYDIENDPAEINPIIGSHESENVNQARLILQTALESLMIG